MGSIAEMFYSYLRDAIYNPKKAHLDIDSMPEDFRDFAEGLTYYVECVMETKVLAQALAKGDLTGQLPPPDNEIASPLKSLHASLKHLTWQTQQVAKGDYQQRVKFMGEFASAFNSMTQQLEERRKLDLKEKNELQQYINLILSNTPDMILVFDTEEKAVLANAAYKQHTKKPLDEEITGTSFIEFISSLSDEEFLCRMEQLYKDALETGHTVQTEQKIDFNKDGSPRNYLIHMTTMSNDDKTLAGTMLVFNDITEIIQARIDAEHARELAERSAKAKSDFLARMSHEMRTPMNAVIGMTTIGKTSPDIEKKDYAFQKIEDASRHLLSVINDILDISNIENDNLELTSSEFCFNDMIGRVTSVASYKAAEKTQEFVIEVDDSIPSTIVSDENRIAQILTYILNNAIKFTPKHGRITLSANKIAETPETCTIRFTVDDTGIGISDAQKEHLFTPFEQADGGVSRKYSGTGLGLAISKRIVEMLGGSIQLDSTLGKGTTFAFDITVQKPAERADESDSENADENDFLVGKRILIAEDVDINREIILALLEDTGLDIIFALDGAEAIDKYVSDNDGYDLILMDIQMPGTDGYEATKRIRASGLPNAETIPIIAMTANVLPEDVERCLAAGMDDHLGKPVDIAEVIAKLTKYIKK